MHRLARVAAAGSLVTTITVVSSGHSTWSMFSTHMCQLELSVSMARSKVHCQSSAVTGEPSAKSRPSCTLKV